MSAKRKRKTTQYVTAYNKKDYQKDEKSFNDSVNNNKPIDFNSFKRLMLSDICANTEIIETGCIGAVKIEDAQLALRYPRKYWKILLQVSEELMRISPHYYRLNSLYSNMPLFCWGIDLYDVKDNANIETVKKTYNALAAKIENMHLKHEFPKIMKYIPYQDIFCGLTIENSTDFFIQRIDYNICKL